MSVVRQKQESKVIDNTRVQITYKLHDLGQGPYFSVTFDQYNTRGRLVSCGAGVERYADHFPLIKRYAKWNLVNVNHGPMHYIANAIYHAGYSPKFPQSLYPGEYYEANRDHLLSTIVYGAVEGDDQVDPMALGKDELVAWLHSRYIALMDAFDRDMRELFA